jgi:hypothetical protein
MSKPVSLKGVLFPFAHRAKGKISTSPNSCIIWNWVRLYSSLLDSTSKKGWNGARKEECGFEILKKILIFVPFFIFLSPFPVSVVVSIGTEERAQSD